MLRLRSTLGCFENEIRTTIPALGWYDSYETENEKRRVKKWKKKKKNENKETTQRVHVFGSDDRFSRSGRLIYLSADKKHLRPPCLIIAEKAENYSTTPSSFSPADTASRHDETIGRWHRLKKPERERVHARACAQLS